MLFRLLMTLFLLNKTENQWLEFKFWGSKHWNMSELAQLCQLKTQTIGTNWAWLRKQKGCFEYRGAMLHFLNFPLHWVLLSCEIDFRPAAKPKIYDKLPSIKFKFWMHWLNNETIVSAETMIPIFLQLWMWILVKLASIIAKRCALVSLTARRAKRR